MWEIGPRERKLLTGGGEKEQGEGKNWIGQYPMGPTKSSVLGIAQIVLDTFSQQYKGSCQKHFSGSCPLRGYPPYPLNGKSFCQKTLSGKGGDLPLGVPAF